MSEYDKNVAAEVFHIPGSKNNEYTIFIATDTYEMDIDNPDVKLVIQWEFTLSHDLMIQQIGCAKKRKAKKSFCFLLPSSQRLKIKKILKNKNQKTPRM